MKTFNLTLYIGFIISLVIMTSCSHTDKVKPPSEIPEIALISTSPGTVTAHEDEINFVIDYTDGDGDLGTNDEKIRNVFIIDDRINVIHEFRLRQLAPDNAEIPITGTFDITLPNTIIVGTTAPETVTFTIYVVDRAGNESNRVTSPELTVVE